MNSRISGSLSLCLFSTDMIEKEIDGARENESQNRERDEEGTVSFHLGF